MLDDGLSDTYRNGTDMSESNHPGHSGPHHGSAPIGDGDSSENAYRLGNEVQQAEDQHIEHSDNSLFRATDQATSYGHPSYPEPDCGMEIHIGEIGHTGLLVPNEDKVREPSQAVRADEPQDPQATIAVLPQDRISQHDIQYVASPSAPDVPVAKKKMRKKRKKVPPRLGEVPISIAEQEVRPQDVQQSLSHELSPAQCPQECSNPPAMESQPWGSYASTKLPVEMHAANAPVYSGYPARAVLRGTPATRRRMRSQPLAMCYSPGHDSRSDNAQPSIEASHRNDNQAGSCDELQSSDWEDNIGRAVEKYHHKEQLTLARYNANIESLNLQLQQAMDANQDLENRMQSLQTEKRDLSELMGAQQAWLGNLNVKANNFKTFLHGLGSDIDVLKKESGVRRKRNEELARELEETKRTQDALLEQSSKLKVEAFKLARDANNELAMVTLRVTQLEEQLGGKSQMLVEEKNARLQLQGQLATSSSDAVMWRLKSHTDTILDKLFEIQAGIEQRGANDLTEVLEKVITATQGLASQQTTTTDDVASLKTIVEAASHSLSSLIDTCGSATNDGPSITSHISEALENFKNDICQHETLLMQATVDRETITHLKQQLDLSNDRVLEQAAELERSQAIWDSLREQHVSLQARVDATRTTVDHDVEMKQLASVQADVQAKAAALAAMEADLITKTDEAKSLADAGTRLRATVVSLQQALAAAQVPPCPDLYQEELADQLATAVKAAREETSRIAHDLYVEEKVKSDNSLKKAISNRDSLLMKVDQLQAALADAKSEAVACAGQQEDLVKLRKLAEDRETEVRNLQTRVDELGRLTVLSHDTQEKYTSLKAQYAAQTQQLHNAVRNETFLTQQLESVKDELDDRKKEVEAAGQGLNHCKSAAQRELANEKDKCQKRVDALQRRLEEVQAEMQVQQQDSREFQHHLQRSWEEHQQQQKEEVTRLTNKAAEVETEKIQALSNCQRLKSELTQALAMMTQKPIPSQDMKNYPRGSHATGDDERGTSQREAVGLCVQAMATTEHESPLRQQVQSGGSAAIFEETRSQMHRPAGSIISGSPFVAASQHDFLGPIMEESQQAADMYPRNYASSSPSKPSRNRELGKRLMDQLMVPNTRASVGHEDDLPTFAKFNASQGFTIYEDPPAIKEKEAVGSAEGARVNQQDLHQSYEFKKQMPPPNSSMKLIRSQSGSQHSQDGSHRLDNAVQQTSRYITPEPHATISEAGDLPLTTGQSSSPEFIADVSKGRTLYHGSAKHNTSTTSKACDPPSQAKRKADTQVVQGYDSQRKKQAVEEPVRGRHGLRSLSQPTSGTLEESGLQSQLDGSHSRMRTWAGTTARPARGNKKMTKSERMSARFARELNGP